MIFIFQLTFVFRILRSWKARFSYRPISLHEFRVFGGQKSSIERMKGKNLIFVVSILQTCQLEIPLFIYKLICQNSLWISVSYGFWEFKCVTSWNKFKTIILIRSSFQICQLEILVLYQRKCMSNVNVFVPKINFDGNLITYVFFKWFWHFPSWKEIVGLCDIYYAKKILNYFGCVAFRFLVQKWNIYEAHIFPRSLLETCWLESISLCLIPC